MVNICNDAHLSTPKGVKISSCLIGIFINLPCIATYLFPSVDGNTDSNGMLGLLYIIIVSLLLINSIHNRTFSIRSINKVIWIQILSILLFYEYSVSVYPEPRTSFYHFLLFSPVALFLASIVKVDIRHVLLTVITTAAPAIFQIKTIFLSSVMIYTSDDILSQGYSYAFLTPAACTIIYLKYYYKSELKYKTGILCVNIINLLFSYFLISLGSRGPVMALVFLVLISYVLKDDTNMIGVRIRTKNALIIIVAVVFMSNYFVPILSLLQSVLDSFNISFHFVDKFLIRNEAGDITSARGDIYDMAMKGFYNHPILGNGFDQFYNNTGRGYPHNFITQTLYDGGLLLFSITILPVLVKLFRWYQCCNHEQFIMILLLFIVSVPGGLVSHDLWEMGNLWFFYGACLNYERFVYR